MFVESSAQKLHSAEESKLACVLSCAKPFLKWVGGKTQLIDQLESNVSPKLKNGEIERYIEPFVGGGSFFLHIAQNYPVKNLVIADSNRDLILAYQTVRERVDPLVIALSDIQTEYLSLRDKQRQEYYYSVRSEFNQNRTCIDASSLSNDWIIRTAQLIFLNKTCFNGLFRVNASGQFNVAFGRYENPRICDASNLIAVSKILARTHILLGDFTCVRELLDSNTFMYLDPPYRPLTPTSNFTAYSSCTFTHDDQQRLAEFCKYATSHGTDLMISNSDPDNIDCTDTYFRDNYPDYRITRAFANRMVNCKADRRGKISELIIMNYPRKSMEPDKTPSMPKSAPARRNGAALGAFKLLYDCAQKKVPFSLDDLGKATGWKAQTARTYVSKKWKNYLEPVDGKRSSYFNVAQSFLKLDEETFLAEFSQVLANTAASQPQNIEDAKRHALIALSNYASMLSESRNLTAEEQIRTLIAQVECV